MIYGHLGGAGGAVYDKFVIVGGKDLDGKLHGKTEYFDGGVWKELDDPTLADFKLSRSCVAGKADLTVGFLIGGSNENQIVPHVWKIDFSKTPLRWTRAASLNNKRHGHKCGVINVRQKNYIVAVGGITDEYYSRNPLVRKHF